MCWTYDYTCPVWNESVRTARKVHRCHECGRKIQPGVKYEYTFCIGEDGACVNKKCERCARMYVAVYRVMRAAGCGRNGYGESAMPPLEELWSSIRDLDLHIRRKIGRTYAYLLRRGWKLEAGK